jgi:two-component system response regulator MtrA
MLLTDAGPHSPAGPAPDVHQLGEVRVDMRSHTVQREGRVVRLHATERRLLGYLLENVGREVTRQELLEYVWGYHPAMSSRTIDVHIAKLRRKLETTPNCPVHLLTVHRVGYKFVR